MNVPASDERTWVSKFNDATNGLFGAVKSHNSFHIHVVVAILVVTMAAGLRCESWQWSVLVIAIGGVLTAELFNTAIEEFVRALHPETDARIGRVLDIAAAAVLVASITAAIAGLIVLLPPMWLFLFGH